VSTIWRQNLRASCHLVGRAFLWIDLFIFFMLSSVHYPYTQIPKLYNIYTITRLHLTSSYPSSRCLMVSRSPKSAGIKNQTRWRYIRSRRWFFIMVLVSTHALGRAVCVCVCVCSNGKNEFRVF